MEVGPTVLLTGSSAVTSNPTNHNLIMMSPSSSNLLKQKLNFNHVVNTMELASPDDWSVVTKDSANYIPIATNSLLAIPKTITDDNSNTYRLPRCSSQHRALDPFETLPIDLPASRHTASDTALRKDYDRAFEQSPKDFANHSPPSCIPHHSLAPALTSAILNRNGRITIPNGISYEQLCVPCPPLTRTIYPSSTDGVRLSCAVASPTPSSEHLTSPQNCTKNSNSLTSHSHTTNLKQITSRLEHSPSFNLFHTRRANSGTKSARRQTDSTVGLLFQRSVDSAPTFKLPTWHANPVFGSSNTDAPNRPRQNRAFQGSGLTTPSVTNDPQDGGGENQGLLPSGRISIGQSSTSCTSGTVNQMKSYTLAQAVNSNSPERSVTHSDQVTAAPSRCIDTVETASALITDPRSRTCCFCWCCCCSCSCMRVRASLQDSKRPSASNDPQSRLDDFNNDDKFTSEEVKSWGESFDLLMQCAAGRKVFREFLRSEYSDENIMFWLACEQLKQETNPELIEEKARMIYEDFISILSPREVSLDSRVREIINANMIEPTPHTFDEAQLQIYTLMHRDSYLRFLNSRMYKELLQRTSNSASTTSIH